MKRERHSDEGDHGDREGRKYSRGDREDGDGYGEGRGYRGRGRGRGRGYGRGRGPDTGYGRHGDSWPVKLDPHSNKVIFKSMVILKREHAGAVIGKGGENVTNVRRDTNASIHVHYADKVTGELLVELTGTAQQLAAAAKRVMDVVIENDPDWNGDIGPVPRLRMHLLPEMVAAVIGRGGSVIKRINDDSGARCKIDNPRGPDEIFQQVQFYGGAEQCVSNFCMVLDVLEQFDASKSRSLRGMRSSFAAPAGDDFNWMGTDSFDDPSVMDPSFGSSPSLMTSPPSAGQPMTFMLPNGQQIQGSQGAPIILMQNPDGTYTQASVVVQGAQSGYMGQPGMPTSARPTMMMHQPAHAAATPVPVQYAAQPMVQPVAQGAVSGGMPTTSMYAMPMQSGMTTTSSIPYSQVMPSAQSMVPGQPSMLPHGVLQLPQGR